MLECKRCKHPLRVTLYARLRDKAGESTPLRCKRCGAVSGYKDGGADIISPPNRPLEYAGCERRSPWMPHNTRPVEVGHYECRFSDYDCVMYWDGIRFRVHRDDASVINMRYFTSWRGKWEVVR